MCPVERSDVMFIQTHSYHVTALGVYPSRVAMDREAFIDFNVTAGGIGAYCVSRSVCLCKEQRRLKFISVTPFIVHLFDFHLNR